MINVIDITTAITTIKEDWGADGEKVTLACFHENPYNRSIGDFLSECTACGGDWGAMLLSGIKRLYPKVYDAIPNEMGRSAWNDICLLLILLGIDASE